MMEIEATPTIFSLSFSPSFSSPEQERIQGGWKEEGEGWYEGEGGEGEGEDVPQEIALLISGH